MTKGFCNNWCYLNTKLFITLGEYIRMFKLLIGVSHSCLVFLKIPNKHIIQHQLIPFCFPTTLPALMAGKCNAPPSSTGPPPATTKRKADVDTTDKPIAKKLRTTTVASTGMGCWLLLFASDNMTLTLKRTMAPFTTLRELPKVREEPSNKSKLALRQYNPAKE
jgi:hypothetical protein